MKALVIGGGIGGFATPLSLHAAGIECEVFEQSRSIREMVEERTPDGFARLDRVASHAELEAIVKGYSKMAGFGQTQVKRRN